MTGFFTAVLGFVPMLLRALSRSRVGIRARNVLGMTTPPGSGFNEIYEQAILEFSDGKPAGFLALFEDRVVKQGFGIAKQKGDPQSFTDALEASTRSRERIAEELRLAGVKLDQQYEPFSAVFDRVAQRVKTPAEVETTQKLDQLIRISQESVALRAEHRETKGAAENLQARADLATELLASGNVSQAREEFLVLLGSAELLGNVGIRARVNNNLGVCFNLPASLGGDRARALDFFEEAHRLKPNDGVMRANLVHALLNRSSEGDCESALQLVEAPPRDGDPQVDLAAARVRALAECVSVEQAAEYARDALHKGGDDRGSPLLTTIAAAVIAETGDVDEGIGILEEALSKQGPKPLLLASKARILMGKVQLAARQYQSKQLALRFVDTTPLNTATDLLREARVCLSSPVDLGLATQVDTDLLISLYRLDQIEDAKYDEVRASLCEEALSPRDHDQLMRNDFLVQLRRRNYSQAYEAVKSQRRWEDSSYAEKLFVARISMHAGAVNEADQLLAMLEESMGDQLDVQYWALRARVMILRQDKVAAFHSSKRMVATAEGTEHERAARHDLAALVQRYADDGEVDRLLEEMLSLQSRYPDEKLVRKLSAIDEKGELTPEARQLLSRQRDWYEGIRSTFEANATPTYFLEEVFGRTYAELLTKLRDHTFPFMLGLPSADYESEVAGNLANSDSMILDYAALLNLAGMGVLGLTPGLGKSVEVSWGVMEKVLEELLRVEHPDLRVAWNTLREDQAIRIRRAPSLSKVDANLEQLFDPWLVDSIVAAIEESCVLVTDDLVLARVLKGELGLRATNSLCILRELHAQGAIDKRTLSRGIGRLAERFYIPLSFDAPDLVEIVAGDGGKLTPRSYHLIAQITREGFNAPAFSRVLASFNSEIWRLGFASEDKGIWLRALTDVLLAALEGLATDLAARIEVRKALAYMWHETAAVCPATDRGVFLGLLAHLQADPRTAELAKLVADKVPRD